MREKLKGKFLLDLRDSETGIQAFRTRPRAIKNSMTAIDAHGVVERSLTLLFLLIAAVGDPAVGLQQDSGAEVFFRVPPVRGARGAAAGA
jgi:hypothetical protein